MFVCYTCKEHLTEEEIKDWKKSLEGVEIERIIQIMYDVGYEDGYDDCIMEGYEEEEEEW